MYLYLTSVQIHVIFQQLIWDGVSICHRPCLSELTLVKSKFDHIRLLEMNFCCKKHAPSSRHMKRALDQKRVELNMHITCQDTSCCYRKTIRFTYPEKRIKISSTWIGQSDMRPNHQASLATTLITIMSSHDMHVPSVSRYNNPISTVASPHKHPLPFICRKFGMPVGNTYFQ